MATNATLAIRNRDSGWTKGLRTPLIHISVSAPGRRHSVRIERSVRASTLVRACTAFSTKPRKVSSRGLSGSSPQRGQKGVATVALQVGQVQARTLMPELAYSTD